MTEPAITEWIAIFISIAGFLGMIISFFFKKKSQEKALSSLESLAESKRIERRSEIRPQFKFAGATTNSNEFNIKLLNEGECAKHLQVKENKNVHLSFLDPNKEYNNRQKIELKGTFDSLNPVPDSKQISFSLELSFDDIDGNTYKQLLTKIGLNYPITNPKLIKK